MFRNEAQRQEYTELKAELANLRTLFSSRMNAPAPQAPAPVAAQDTEGIAEIQSAVRQMAKKIEEVTKLVNRGLTKRDLDAVSASVAKTISGDNTNVRSVVNQSNDALRQHLRQDMKKELQNVSNQVRKISDVVQPGQISEHQARAIGNALSTPVMKYLDHAVANAFAPVMERMAKQIDKSFKDLGAAVGTQVSYLHLSTIAQICFV